jgi:hypothetical protein
MQIDEPSPQNDFPVCTLTKKAFPWAASASSLFITFTSITSFDVRLSILLKTFGATAFISATTFASLAQCELGHIPAATNTNELAPEHRLPAL